MIAGVRRCHRDDTRGAAGLRRHRHRAQHLARARRADAAPNGPGFAIELARPPNFDRPWSPRAAQTSQRRYRKHPNAESSRAATAHRRAMQRRKRKI